MTKYHIKWIIQRYRIIDKVYFITMKKRGKKIRNLFDRKSCRTDIESASNMVDAIHECFALSIGYTGLHHNIFIIYFQLPTIIEMLSIHFELYVIQFPLSISIKNYWIYGENLNEH